MTGLQRPERIALWPEELETSQRSTDFPVLGSSLAAILRYALDHDGLLPREASTLDAHAAEPIVAEREPPAGGPLAE